MNRAELEEIEKLAKEATPDEWWADDEEFTENGYYEEPRVFGRDSDGEPYLLFTAAVGHREVQNSRFVAKMSPFTVYRMVKRIRELEEALWYICDDEENPSLAFDNCIEGGHQRVNRAIEIDAEIAANRAALAVSGEDVGK